MAEPPHVPIMGSVPLRFRLTAWYITLLALTLLAFCSYLYLRLEQSLLAQLDAALAVAATQAPVQYEAATSLPHFDATTTAARQLTDAGFGLRLLNANGTMREALGIADAPLTTPVIAGSITVETNTARWRIYSQPISTTDQAPTGWIQVIQPLAPVQVALEELSRQMLLGFPLALLLATAGGLFLARRALAPVDRMTSTAAVLSASDLTRRIGYIGLADELGRLATTFDAMLDRLAASFAHERRFTADATHELRTPLTALKGRIEVALSRQRSTEEYATTLHALAGDVDRLVRLSDDLLLLARLDDGELRPQFEPVRLDDLLASVVESVADLAEARGVLLHYHAPAAPVVMGDLSQLGRLFLNLLDNALKFTPTGGRVDIHLSADATRAIVTIADTGPGIAPQYLPLLGQRFYRGSADRARGAGGSGLGLAIAGEIARAHAGTLSVASQVREHTDAIYLAELQALTNDLLHIHIHMHTTATAGRLSAEQLEALSGAPLTTQCILLCGPTAMMHALTSQLIARGVRPSQIISEEFAMR
ncbi:MAG: ATP-binding protein [Roseiflexaceae bacterium]